MAKIPENVLNVLGECRADGNLLCLLYTSDAADE